MLPLVPFRRASNVRCATLYIFSFAAWFAFFSPPLTTRAWAKKFVGQSQHGKGLDL
jgi:hypothetical protein